ncbi:CDP-alcohol phosphatidyltransferase family protein [Pseudobacteriovorax antillogorgiicola]|uniref:Phosphatidylglycerophosphate synthase n=1 Tax=Pseudobacteriovorax antillogorgiicola TaxID=1513793 RepID=A0A1Y6CGD1_9BACT|nr:CDP-alcohol phosphatidyltransferase family protein [Pseudobacteriovorax antillogorgiicola]TCS49096.1 phosphatidylglycerophosphate synthase [Pseudobacteriovorax antillogorgiicola]SMF51772.1 Phosphatidylglycerophosphate synthase [Pseudobacteriovorax antillogorgiicola]
MIDDPFRKVLPRFTAPLIRFYRRYGLSPNQITLMALLLAGLASVAVGIGLEIVALILWWSSRLLDGTDGILARETQQSSDFGAFLDIVCDMAAYSVMIFGFASLYPEYEARWMTMLFFYVLCITGALSLGAIEERRALSPGDNRGIRLAAGLAEGGETGIAYSAFLLFPDWIGITTLIWITVLVFTVAARATLAWTLLRPDHHE